MSSEATENWVRALRALESSNLLLIAGDPDGAASRAYSAAFHAFCAWFSFEGLSHRRHSELEAAIHRELVHRGRLPKELGRAFGRLREYRARADYGVDEHVSDEAAREAIESARQILEHLRRSVPGIEG